MRTLKNALFFSLSKKGTLLHCTVCHTKKNLPTISIAIASSYHVQDVVSTNCSKTCSRNSDSFSNSSSIQRHSVAFSFKRTCSCSLLLLPQTIASKVPRSGRLGCPKSSHVTKRILAKHRKATNLTGKACFPLASLNTENLSSQTNSRIRACVHIAIPQHVM